MNLGPVPHVDSSRPPTTSLTRLSLLPSFPQRSAETEHFLVFLSARTVLYTHSEKNSTKVYRYAVICGHFGLSLKEIAVFIVTFCLPSKGLRLFELGFLMILGDDVYLTLCIVSNCYWRRKMMSSITTWHSGRRVIDTERFPHNSHWRNNSTSIRIHGYGVREINVVDLVWVLLLISEVW